MTKQTQILIATLKVISEKGYSGTTMSEVAKHAGIGKSTIYEYFESKETLIMEATVYFANAFIERIYKQAWSKGHDYKSILNASIELMITELGNEFSNPESFMNSFQEMNYCEETQKRYAVAMKPVMEVAALHTKDLIELGQKEGILKPFVDDIEIFMVQRTLVILSASFLKEQPFSGPNIDENIAQSVNYISRFVTKALSPDIS